MDSKNQIEQSMRKIHSEYYDEWINNFALNLSSIWEEPSVNELGKNKTLNDNSSAIVIGRGPSLKKNHHLELLAKSNYEGSIVCTDGSLSTVLDAGVTPDKFPKFFVVTIEPYSKIKTHYEKIAIKKYSHPINGIFPTIASPEVVQSARKAGVNIFWMHLLFDYNEGPKSFNYITAKITRAKKHSDGLPGFQTGGNAGTAAWFFSWKILKCSTVSLIGIDLGWNEEDSFEKIISHGFEDPNKKVKVSKNDYNKFVKKIYNPDFACYSILDPIFDFYRTLFLEFVERSPSWLTTVNATEGGSIFGSSIKCMKFKQFLLEFKK